MVEVRQKARRRRRRRGGGAATDIKSNTLAARTCLKKNELFSIVFIIFHAFTFFRQHKQKRETQRKKRKQKKKDNKKKNLKRKRRKKGMCFCFFVLFSFGPFLTPCQFCCHPNLNGGVTCQKFGLLAIVYFFLGGSTLSPP